MLNKDDIVTIEKKRIRGLILQNLKLKYPEGVDFEVLRKALEYQGHNLSSQELVSLIEYLKAAKYINVTYFKNMILTIKLEKTGMDISDRIIHDNGILIA